MDFDVDMKPVGKGRPRFTRSGHAYTPPATTEAEEKIRLAYRNKYGKVCYDKDEPIRLIVVAYFPIPKAMSRKDTEMALRGMIYPTKKPDGDNILKLVADALNGVAYYDDSQIIDMHIDKLYAAQPRIHIILEEK